MKDELIAVLQTLKYPVYQQGSIGSSQKYDDSFFTFWNNDSWDDNHYDNNPASWTWSFDVNFYSTSPALVNSVLLQAKALLVASGWVISGKGHEVASDEITHTGRGMTCLFKERNTSFPVTEEE